MGDIIIRNNVDFEKELRRFKKICEKNNINADAKRKSFYDKPSVRKRKKKVKSLRRRNKKELLSKKR